jgi:hypothetical protein
VARRFGALAPLPPAVGILAGMTMLILVVACGSSAAG